MKTYIWLPVVRTMQVCAPGEGRVYTLATYKPEGLDCGHGGREAGNLAFAILTDCCGANVASDLYGNFKWDVIAKKASDVCWSITEDEILAWKDEKVGELRRRVLEAAV